MIYDVIFVFVLFCLNLSLCLLGKTLDSAFAGYEFHVRDELLYKLNISVGHFILVCNPHTFISCFI